MVHPVRSVGETPLAVQCLILDAPLAVRWRLARLGRIYIPWNAVPWVLALLDRCDVAPCAGPGRSAVYALRPPDEALGIALRATEQPETRPVEQWQPWPARKPFADEVDRWWPSHELPPIEHEAPPDGPPVRPVPEFPLYPVRGGLLSVWA